MKRALSILLAMVLVFSFSSCDLIKQFLSFERVEVTANDDPITDPNRPDPELPDKDKLDPTTPEDDREQTTPDDPAKDENNDGIPDADQPADGTTDGQKPEDKPQDGNKEPENTTGSGDSPTAPELKMITVEIIYQTFGVHRVQSVITTTAPATLLEVYNLFANEYPYEWFNSAECYLNDKPIDPTQTVYMQDGDKIYLQESSDGYHLHIWDTGMGRCHTCMEECSHEWEDSICRICKCVCYHSNWSDGQCTGCGKMCEHSEWDDNRQCTTCYTFLGVDLLQIEIWENGEYKCNASRSTETTIQELMLAYYGPYPWHYWDSMYEFYFNGVLVTHGSFIIAENGVLNLVTRTHEFYFNGVLVADS